jgi:hypothetical protein
MGMSDITNGDVPGKAAYERYVKATGSVYYDGTPRKAWSQLPERVRQSWQSRAAM